MKRAVGPNVGRWSGLAWVALLAWSGAFAAELPAPASEAFQQDLAWSPDGRFIAFSEYVGGSDYKPGGWAIHVIEVRGTERRLLARNASSPTWAANGLRLAFGSNREGNWDIYTILTDGKRERRLTSHEANDRQPAWSPRGDKIAFSSDRDGNPEIYVMAQNGSEPTRLTDDPASDYQPTWSRDQSQIVFYREKSDGMDQINVVATDGSTGRAVTADEANNVFPSFLKSGRIGFSTKAKEGLEMLVTVAPDGTGREQVGPPGIFFARWSPNDAWVAFIAGEWPTSAIYLMKADGTEIKKLVN